MSSSDEVQVMFEDIQTELENCWLKKERKERRSWKVEMRKIK